MAFDNQGKPIIGFDDSSALPIIGHTPTGNIIYGTLHSETSSQPGTGDFSQAPSVDLDSIPLGPSFLDEKPLDSLAPVHDRHGESYRKTPGPSPAAVPDIDELKGLMAGLLRSSQVIIDQSVITTNCLNDMGGRFTTWSELYGKRAVSWEEWQTLLKTHLLTRGWEQKLRHKFMLLRCLDTTPTAFDSFFHLLISYQTILRDFEDPLGDVDVSRRMLDGVDGLVTHWTKAALKANSQTVLMVKPADLHIIMIDLIDDAMLEARFLHNSSRARPLPNNNRPAAHHPPPPVITHVQVAPQAPEGYTPMQLEWLDPAKCLPLGKAGKAA
ncbi:hypothetical protein I311_06980 [Cryptococcus gattii NT-10]|nr:hypothetical protein I311_06980 [Cryptococcus gattii NT-10]